MKEFRNIKKDNFNSHKHYCKHNVAITTTMNKVISYCTICGKILDIKVTNEIIDFRYGYNGEEGEILHD